MITTNVINFLGCWINLPSTVLSATFSDLADHCCRYGIGRSTCKCNSDPRPSWRDTSTLVWCTPISRSSVFSTVTNFLHAGHCLVLWWCADTTLQDCHQQDILSALTGIACTGNLLYFYLFL
uniref:AlNc14C15G1671 protein n=1 Tax=Albugo laibachii Nc14 TaxID=890382 RepID=F0W3X0_9STRA|nr:AlNc14C15G1671 [Albugo laibachii Nc14]|eukprot:CCA15765.1 AlNc14C15G1671 [Albugo laibachii Nc14]